LKACKADRYPPQNPVALLERIVQASSNSGDVVLDPFCGCGTTIDAAEKLGRKWIGIDVTQLMEGKGIERPTSAAASDKTFKKAPTSKRKSAEEQALPGM
jgi:site-specific DNA-methyltransferase (adenine-specific)